MQICYIISDINKALAFEWIATAFQNSIDIRFIILNSGNSELERFLNITGVPVIRVKCRGKRDWLGALCLLVSQLREWNPEVVHCHLLQASILGLIASWFVGCRRRIVTRHHGDLHHRYHKKGVLWDKLCNALATDIVAISGNVQCILTEMDHAPAEKIHVIPHGFNWKTFRNIEASQVHNLHYKYDLHGKSPVIGCISRFTEWKGIQYIIPAFKKFLQLNPDAVLVLANSQGDYASQLQELLNSLPIESYRLISFEPAVAELYKCYDLFVHVPVDSKAEAFGQVYVEALAAEVPSIFTISGIASDFIEHGKNGWVVPYRDSDSIEHALKVLWQTPEIRSQLKSNGWDSVKEKFSLSQMILRLKALYGV